MTGHKQIKTTIEWTWCLCSICPSTHVLTHRAHTCTHGNIKMENK